MKSVGCKHFNSALTAPDPDETKYDHEEKRERKNIQECSLHGDGAAVMLVCMVVVALNMGLCQKDQNRL